MAVSLVLLTIAATVNGGGGARHQDNLPRTHGGHLSGGAGSADGGGGGGGRHGAIVEREGEGRGGSALCRPPAQPVSVDDADWCACFEGLMCEGSDCDVDMWDPEEVIFLLFLFISLKKKSSIMFSHLLLRWPTSEHTLPNVELQQICTIECVPFPI